MDFKAFHFDSKSSVSVFVFWQPYVLFLSSERINSDVSELLLNVLIFLSNKLFWFEFPITFGGEWNVTVITFEKRKATSKSL